jgi:hypothetical protein
MHDAWPIQTSLPRPHLHRNKRREPRGLRVCSVSFVDNHPFVTTLDCGTPDELQPHGKLFTDRRVGCLPRGLSSFTLAEV